MSFIVWRDDFPLSHIYGTTTNSDRTPYLLKGLYVKIMKNMENFPASEVDNEFRLQLEGAKLLEKNEDKKGEWDERGPAFTESNIRVMLSQMHDFLNREVNLQRLYGVETESESDEESEGYDVSESEGERQGPHFGKRTVRKTSKKLKEQAKRLKIRVTFTRNGKRYPKSADSLRKQIKTKLKKH